MILEHEKTYLKKCIALDEEEEDDFYVRGLISGKKNIAIYSLGILKEVEKDFSAKIRKLESDLNVYRTLFWGMIFCIIVGVAFGSIIFRS